jgi:hypothetical protein
MIGQPPHAFHHKCPKRGYVEVTCYLPICPLCKQGKGCPVVNDASIELGKLIVNSSRKRDHHQ